MVTGSVFFVAMFQCFSLPLLLYILNFNLVCERTGCVLELGHVCCDSPAFAAIESAIGSTVAGSAAATVGTDTTAEADESIVIGSKITHSGPIDSVFDINGTRRRHRQVLLT